MPKVNVKGTRNTSATLGKNPEITDESFLEAREVPEEHCMRIVRIGHTLNMGNYESLRVDSEVRIPCTKEDLPKSIEEAYSHCREGLDYITMMALESRGRNK